MKKTGLKSLQAFLALIFASLACNMPSAANVDVNKQVEVIASAPAIEFISTPLPTETAAPIVHVVSPVSGVFHESTAHDNEESATYEFKNVEFGDVFEVNRFERPFLLEDMVYLPYIDIFDFEMTAFKNLPQATVL